MRQKMLKFCAIFASLGVISHVHARDYYVDSKGGDNGNDGKTEATAWKSIWKINQEDLSPGDEIFLKRDSVFYSRLIFDNDDGTAANPITVKNYGDGALPLINSAGYKEAIRIYQSNYISLEDVTIKSDGGAPLDDHDPLERYGIYIQGSDYTTLDNVNIENIFAYEQTEIDDVWQAGKNMSGNFGKGIYITNSDNTIITNSYITKTGHHGIHMFNSANCTIEDSILESIGGPGIVPNGCDYLKVQNIKVWTSGSYADTRMFGRGSGIWPINCEHVLIEKSVFRGANGRADSCGVHIDHDNKHVVVQYNISEDNEGGFVEILGGNENCTYRYNVSINDGYRTSDDYDTGTLGYTIVVNGHGDHDTKNCYIYNNTVYVKGGLSGRFGVEDTTSGLLVANNIFHFVDDGLTGNYASHEPAGVVWKNNLYQSADDFPSALTYENQDATIGWSTFNNPGGIYISDYTPNNAGLVKDAGMDITELSGDSVGIKSWDGIEGLTVTKDILGNNIQGAPDFGAIEMQ